MGIRKKFYRKERGCGSGGGGAATAGKAKGCDWLGIALF